MGNHEILSVNNTNIISAVGSKSKSIRKQIFCEVIIRNSLSVDCVFLIVPGLVRNCILGMNFLHQSRSVINIPERWIQFQPEGEVIDEERLCEIPLLSMEEINKKIGEQEGVSQTRKYQLGQLLTKNKRIFNERPGLITGYQHCFRVTDSTPYLQKGWPVVIKYQRAFQEEIKRMLDYGVIELSLIHILKGLSRSPYIGAAPHGLIK